jgi:hypothetical protein
LISRQAIPSVITKSVGKSVTRAFNIACG